MGRRDHPDHIQNFSRVIRVHVISAARYRCYQRVPRNMDCSSHEQFNLFGSELVPDCRTGSWRDFRLAHSLCVTDNRNLFKLDLKADK